MGGVAKKTILVVDDEVELCDALCFDFEDAGYATLKAHSGNEAKSLLKQNKVDLIISDVRMPNGSGIELLVDVKERNSEEPVVLLVSGYTDVQPEVAYNLGAEGIFAKPFDVKLLLRHVDRCLRPKARRWERVDASPTAGVGVALKLPGFEASLKAALLNMGRGGMCLSLDGELPAVGQIVSFDIAFIDGRWTPIAGTGVVRWRKVEDGNESKRIGVEFADLTEASLPHVLSLIEMLRPQAYIPKD